MNEAPKLNKYTTSFERPPPFCGQVYNIIMYNIALHTVSEAPVEEPKPKKYESYNAATYKTDEEKKKGANECDQREARAARQTPATGPDRGSG